MCGIAGILNLRDKGEISPDTLKWMLSSIKHRGPDEFAVYRDSHIGIAHARLSIIDLSGGQQPMANEDSTVWITLNGEVFNYVELRLDLIKRGHKFRTHSDTEVIIHLYEDYGHDCLHYLNGQFAFAIWDSSKQELFLARDRVGIRPLFYASTPDRFYFASEIKAILATDEISREVDPVALDQIFSIWCTVPPQTAFKGIYELPPGHFLIVRDSSIKEEQYWDVSFSEELRSLTINEAMERLKDLLIDSARLQLRADVPIGAYLSGGLDSSITAALIRCFSNSPLKTFSVGFEDEDYDESVYQFEMARRLGTEHSEIRCTYSDISQNFPRVIWHTEKPVLRTAPTPLFLLSKMVSESNFKVVLTGEGADEVLGGYDIFKETKIRQFWARFPESRYRPLLLKRLYPYLPAFQKQPEAYTKVFFRGGRLDTTDAFFSHRLRWDTTSKIKLFFSEELKRVLKDINFESILKRTFNPDFFSYPPLSRAQYIEMKNLLPGYILSSQGDRMAMAHSVEGRFPFLDHRVIEFCASLPQRYKMKVLNEKYILKQCMKSFLPQNILQRTKQPYLAPDSKSFFCDGKSPDYVSELLSEDCIRRYGYFNHQAVRMLVNKCRRGGVTGFKDNMAVVGILSTQLLHKQFIEDFRHHTDNLEKIVIREGKVARRY